MYVFMYVYMYLYMYIRRKQNGQMRRIKFSLIKMIQWHQEVSMKYNKSIEEVMQATGFLLQIKTSKSNILFNKISQPY